MNYLRLYLARNPDKFFSKTNPFYFLNSFRDKPLLQIQNYLNYIVSLHDGYQVPDGLGVRIPGFHPGGPGSIPGLGVIFLG